MIAKGAKKILAMNSDEASVSQSGLRGGVCLSRPSSSCRLSSSRGLLELITRDRCKDLDLAFSAFGSTDCCQTPDDESVPTVSPAALIRAAHKPTGVATVAAMSANKLKWNVQLPQDCFPRSSARQKYVSFRRRL